MNEKNEEKASLEYITATMKGTRAPQELHRRGIVQAASTTARHIQTQVTPLSTGRQTPVSDLTKS